MRHFWLEAQVDFRNATVHAAFGGNKMYVTRGSRQDFRFANMHRTVICLVTCPHPKSHDPNAEIPPFAIPNLGPTSNPPQVWQIVHVSPRGFACEAAALFLVLHWAPHMCIVPLQKASCREQAP